MTLPDSSSLSSADTLIATVLSRLTALEAENAALRADNAQLRAENAKLREKLDLPPKTPNSIDSRRPYASRDASMRVAAHRPVEMSPAGSCDSFER